MKKQKIALLTLLALVLSVCCLMFAACGGGEEEEPAVTFNVTWSIASHVTVEAEGYDELPTEVAKGTKVVFTAVADSGYEVSAVKPLTKITKQSDGSYAFTANADIEVTVEENEIISSIAVTSAPTKLEYYAGESIDTEGMVVTVNYATGRSETTTAYTISYENADSNFIVGDTKFTVSYAGFDKDVELSSAVIGKVEIDLFGGVIDDAALEAYKDFTDYNYDKETGIISWTFDSPIAEDISLPDGQYVSKEISGNIFPFLSWSASKIAKDTNVSVSIKANYDAQLLEITGLQLINKKVVEDGEEITVPYFIITGNFIAATEAYLYLYEGNAKVSLKGTVITKGDTDAFTLEFDLREFVAATVMAEVDGEMTEIKLNGKWMDIKFQASFGERVETQEINLNNYPADFVDTGDNLSVLIGDTWYKFYYATHLDTLKLVYTPSTLAKAYDVTNAKLDVRTFTTTDEAGKEVEYDAACLVLTGIFRAEVTVDEAKAAISTLFIDIMNKANNSWNTIAFDKIITVLDEDELEFEVVLTLNNASAGQSLFSHLTNATDDNFVLSAARLETGSVTVGYLQYDISIYRDWGSDLVAIDVSDTRTYEIVGIDLKVEGDDVYVIISGTYENYTVEDLEKCFYVDFQQNVTYSGSGNWERLTDFDTKVTANSDGTFTIKLKVTEVADNAYTGHLQTDYSGSGDPADFKFGETVNLEVTLGNRTYKLVSWPEEENIGEYFWNCVGLIIETGTAD